MSQNSQYANPSSHVLRCAPDIRSHQPRTARPTHQGLAHPAGRRHHLGLGGFRHVQLPDERVPHQERWLSVLAAAFLVVNIKGRIAWERAYTPPTLTGRSGSVTL